MASVFHEGYIYVLGGLNYTEKIMKKCERLLIVSEEVDYTKVV